MPVKKKDLVKKKHFLIAAKEDFIFLILVVFITWVAWHGVLNQIISGEGYIYFSSPYSLLYNLSAKELVHNIDNLPRILFFLMERFFQGNIQPYANALFITIILINLSIYWLVKKLTNNSIIALLSAVFAGANFSSSFQFYARGHYQWFVQRVPQLFFVFLGIYFMDRFFKRGTKKDYLFSLGFYIFAMFMNYYTTLSLPLYLGFIFVYTIFRKNWYKRFGHFIAFSVPFILITYYLNVNATLSLDIIRPHQSFLESILNNKEIFQKIAFQLSVISSPLIVKEILAVFFKVSLMHVVNYMIVPTFFVYFLIFLYLQKRNFNFFKLSLGLFLGILGNLYLNVYLGRVNIYNEIQQGRYYYNSTIYLSIIWAVFTFLLLNPLFKRKYLKIVLLSLIIMIYTAINVKYIWRYIRVSQYEYTGGKKMLLYLGSRKDNLPKGALVFLPNPLMPSGEDFLKKFYSGDQTKFLYIDSKWKSKIPADFESNKIFVFDYSDEYKRVGKADISRIEVLDKSEQFRKDFKTQ